MYQLPKFIGLTNFKLLILDDDVFIIALKNTLIFALISGPAGFVMSFVMAWVINQMRFRTVFALAFYAPSITSSVAISVVWMTFFSNDQYGYINNFLMQLGILTKPILWLSDPNTIMGVIIFISIWMGMGAGFLTFLAGLQNMPSEVYEAGMVDGVSNRFQELFYITLPQLKPQMLFAAINSIIASFAVFDIAITVAGLPSPNYAGHTLVTHLYDHAFIRFEMGYASAVSVMLFTITIVAGQLVKKLLATKE